MTTFSGTFAVVSLMVSNGITTVLTEQGLDYCLEMGNSSSIVNDSNMTCGDLKAQVAFSLAFISGVIMVCRFSTVRVLYMVRESSSFSLPTLSAGPVWVLWVWFHFHVPFRASHLWLHNRVCTLSVHKPGLTHIWY